MSSLPESSICSLAPETVHLLKSAQVITSVSAVVKELTENALDAGTTLLSVRLEKYGLQRVEVKDNGTGISEADLQQVCRPHTTSKLSCFSDLERLLSYGFRGEALSSLCQVGSVTLTTRQTGAIKGYMCDYGPDGIIVNKKVAAANPGTTVTVASLFRCLPVRRQYHGDPRRCKDQLKRIEELLMAYSLARPDLHVTLTHDKTMVYQKSPAPSVLQALHAVFPGVARGLKAHTEAEQQITVTAHLPDRHSSQPASVLSRSSTDRLFILVNGRPVQHKQIEKVIKAYYSGGSEGVHGRYPIGLVSFTLPSDAVDVNLEPNKDRILFKDQDTVMKLVAAVLTALYGPLAAAVSGEDGLVCSLAPATQPVAGDGASVALPTGGCPPSCESLLEPDRTGGNAVTDLSQNGGDRISRVDYDDDDFFSDSTDKENRSNHSNNFGGPVVPSRKMNVKNPALAKFITVDRGIRDAGKSACLQLQTNPSSAVDDALTNSTSLEERRFVSSTPPLPQSSSNNDPTFGSLSSIDILSLEDQNVLAEILSQDVTFCPRDKPQTNDDLAAIVAAAVAHSEGDGGPAVMETNDHVMDQEREPVAAEDHVAGSSSSLNCLLTGADRPIDPAAWSKGHVWAQDGTNIQSVEVIGTVSSSTLPLPRHRSCSSPTESPAKRFKLSHDSRNGSSSSAVDDVFSSRKQLPNDLTSSSVEAGEKSGTCDETILRFCAPQTKAQRNLMVSQDDPCSPPVNHASTKNSSFHTTSAGVTTGRSALPQSNSPITNVSTSTLTPTQNPNNCKSSVAPSLRPPANSSDRPSVGPKEAVGDPRHRGPKESPGDRRARQAVLSVAGSEAHGGQLVRKPVTAFAAFAKDIRNTVLSEYPGAAFTVVGREIAARWKALDAATRARYEQLARDDADRYQKEVRKLRDSSCLGSPSIHDVTMDRFVSSLLGSCSSPTLKTEASPKVKKEPQVPQRPWMERGVTVRATVADIGNRLQRAAQKTPNTEDSSESYKVIGKIRFPSSIKAGTSDVTSKSGDITSLGDEISSSSPSVMCFVCLDPSRRRIMGLHSHRLQEVSLCYRLLERYSVPRRLLNEPLPFNASSLGEANWRALLQLDHRPHDRAAFRVVTDPRLTDNGLQVVLYTAGSQQPATVTHGELREVAANVGFFGLSDLQEVLAVLANTPSAALIQTRPVKLRHWIQGECVRMIRDGPALTSCDAVTEKLVLWQHYRDTYTTATAGHSLPSSGCSSAEGGLLAVSLSSGSPKHDIVLGPKDKKECGVNELRKVNNDIEGKHDAVDNTSNLEQGLQTKVAVLGLPDASVCLHHKPIMHELYDLDELPGSQSQNKTHQSQDPVEI